ncbi:hypothetical protein BH23GEM2_BH23GEM2_25120 [soil metagenome]
MSFAFPGIPLVAAAVLLFGSCSTSPTETEIIDSLKDADEQAVRSVVGPWIGVAQWPETMELEYVLAQAGPGQVSGSGTMRESAAGPLHPIAVQGTYQRPNLVLTFSGLVYEGHSVTGAFTGQYLRAAGVRDSLRLTGESYSKAFEVLLQER